MKVSINKEVFDRFNQDFTLALIKVEKFDSITTRDQSKHLLKDVEKLVHLSFQKETLKNHNLISPWAVAQQEFGKKAKHYHTSVERLMKKVLSGKSVATKNPIENVVRYISLKYIIPISIDDQDKIKGGLTFALSTGKEKADTLRTLRKGALYYKDTKGPLGTKLDFWKSKRTALIPESEIALIHIEALPPISRGKLREIISELRSLLNAFTGAKTSVVVLDKKKNKGIIQAVSK